MFSNRARILVTGALVILGVISYNWHEPEITAAIGMFILLMIWGFFKEGTIIIAAKSFHKKDYERTEQLLKQVIRPEWLSKKRRGFYEFIMGGIYLQKQEFEEAEKHYELAARFPLRSANDHVAALGHVVNINIRQGNYEKAKAYLQLADKYEDKTNAKMKEVIKRLHEALKNK
jgi:tetratricopeptide (TPR) repeat protein